MNQEKKIKAYDYHYNDENIQDTHTNTRTQKHRKPEKENLFALVK